MYDIFFLNVHSSYVWFLIAFIAVMVELMIPGLFYFLAGSISATIIGLSTIYFFIPISTQIILFCICSIVVFFILKKCAEKNTYEQKNHYVPHLNKLLHKEGIVVTEIKEGISGQVRVNNEIWMAYSVDKKEIPVGTKIRVTGIAGVHVIVQVVENPSSLKLCRTREKNDN